MFMGSLAGDCTTEAEMRAGCKNNQVTTTSAPPAPVSSASDPMTSLIAQILPNIQWVRSGLTGGATVASLQASVAANVAQFSTLPPLDVARYIAEQTARYIKAGGKTSRAIVNLQYEQTPDGVIAVPYPVTYSGHKWKCANNQPISQQTWDILVRQYGEAGAIARTDKAYCGPDENRAIKAFVIAAATMVIGGVAAAYLAAPAATASGAGAAGAAGAAGGGAAAGGAAGAGAGAAAAAVPVGVEVVTVTAAAPALTSAAVAAGSVAAGAAAGSVLTTSSPPAISQPSIPAQTPPPVSAPIETVVTTASALPTAAPVVAATGAAAGAGAAIVATSTPPPPVNTTPAQPTPSTEVAQDPATIETVTTTATSIPTAAAPITAAGGTVAGAILATSTPPAPVNTSQAPSQSSDTGSNSGEGGSGDGTAPPLSLADRIKDALTSLLGQYGQQWLQDHLAEELANQMGRDPTQQELDDWSQWIDEGATGTPPGAVNWLPLLALGAVVAVIALSGKGKKGSGKMRRRVKRK